MEQDCEFHETRKMLLPPLVGSRFVLHSNATAGHDWSPRWAQIVLPPVVGATLCEIFTVSDFLYPQRDFHYTTILPTEP